MPAAANPPAGPLTLEVLGIIKGAMGRKDIKARDLVPFVGVSEGQLSKILSGQKPLSMDLLDEICIALSLNLNAVLSEADALTKSRLGGAKPHPQPGAPS